MIRRRQYQTPWRRFLAIVEKFTGIRRGYGRVSPGWTNQILGDYYPPYIPEKIV